MILADKRSSITVSYTHLLAEGNFINMLHLGVGAFEENVGTIVQNVAFTRRKGCLLYTSRCV